MVFNTLSVGAAVTPTVIETWFSHYLKRKPLHEKPTAHISYHVGLQLVRQFLTYASHHTVEDLQAFTSQWVPTPRWVRTEDIDIPANDIEIAAKYLIAQLGPQGIEEVGGPTWWQWRQDGHTLKAEWIEMRKDYNARRHAEGECTRTMLYVHGGAYYFGSVDEHRYQMQRHARKLQARVLAPRYRLAPQFPFPCGLLDCLAAYLYLLNVQPPETILLAGDSAGGAMLVAILVILRDQGISLPAGAILLSPWVDLTHSFPSVSGWNELDYVPPHGFVHRPSNAWPPPNADDLKALEDLAATGFDNKNITMQIVREEAADEANKEIQDQERDATQGFSTIPVSSTDTSSNPIPGDAPTLSVTIDNTLIEVKDQIQIYAPNHLLSHPLVSPVLQPSLGGLPPLLFLVGGGEMLRDEQIYLAHKAAAPTNYPPSASHLASQSPHAAEEVARWPPTNVQLQVWDDLCHVAPTLSFTRPAKYMYRSVAQFGAWALARAQKCEITILDDDEVSVISSRSSSFSSTSSASSPTAGTFNAKTKNRPTHCAGPPHHRQDTDASESKSAGAVGTAGAPLPPFTAHMIRQRVTRHGVIYPLDPASSLPACTMNPEEIGILKPGPVRKWLDAQKAWGKRYAKEKRAVQEYRVREMRKMAVDGGRAGVYEGGERPPPTALVGRCGGGVEMGVISSGRKRLGGFGLKIWSGWGSRHDEDALGKEEEKERRGEQEEEEEGRTSGISAPVAEGGSGVGDGFLGVAVGEARSRSVSRARSRTKSVVDEGQVDEERRPVMVDGRLLKETEARSNPQRFVTAAEVLPDRLA